jgi:hypothetical protein
MKRVLWTALTLLAGASVAGQQPGTAPQPAARYSSRIMIHDLRTKTSTLVHEADTVWEAPNWSRDGRFLLSK